MPDDWSDEQAMGEYRKVHEQGPVGFVIARAGGPVMPPTMFIRGIATNLATALLAAVLLWAARLFLCAYLQRVLFMTVLGALVGVTVHITYWNWMHFPADYTLVMVLDTIAMFLLAGIVMAAVVRERVVDGGG